MGEATKTMAVEDPSEVLAPSLVPPSATLYVGDLDPSVTETDLLIAFASIGPIASVRLCRDRFSRESLRYAYLNFFSPVHGNLPTLFPIPDLHLLHCFLIYFRSLLWNRPWCLKPRKRSSLWIMSLLMASPSGSCGPVETPSQESPASVISSLRSAFLIPFFFSPPIFNNLFAQNILFLVLWWRNPKEFGGIGERGGAGGPVLVLWDGGIVQGGDGWEGEEQRIRLRPDGFGDGCAGGH